MITRIVRLTIAAEKQADFERTFWSTYPLISAVSGCTELKLFRDADLPEVFITFSKWNRAEDLEAYRNSELFKRTWDTVKPMFAAKAVAFSMVDSPALSSVE